MALSAVLRCSSLREMPSLGHIIYYFVTLKGLLKYCLFSGSLLLGVGWGKLLQNLEGCIARKKEENNAVVETRVTQTVWEDQCGKVRKKY